VLISLNFASSNDVEGRSNCLELWVLFQIARGPVKQGIDDFIPWQAEPPILQDIPQLRAQLEHKPRPFKYFPSPQEKQMLVLDTHERHDAGHVLDVTWLILS
jgi:hypothetical protein